MINEKKKIYTYVYMIEDEGSEGFDYINDLIRSSRKDP